MKSLKITFAVLSLLVLTVSGTSLESVEKNDVTKIEQTNYEYDLFAHQKRLRKLTPTG